MTLRRVLFTMNQRHIERRHYAVQHLMNEVKNIRQRFAIECIHR